ncbi:porin [Spiribacter insolitus]|uniref:Porin n=1 Tax=Spiribacter insolitus TaxID=3122417 RepID=A0ABV3TBU3_9GAMM
MKKMTILTAATSALALSAGIASAQEEAESMEVGSTTSSFYGFVLAGFSDQDVNQSGSTVGSDGGNGPSRFGFLGETVLADGMTGGVQIEYSVANASAASGGQTSNPGLRQANAYLTGDFGRVEVGSQDNSMYEWTTGTTDLFLTSAFQQARATDVIFRQDGAIFYTTPDFDGLQLRAGGTLQRGDNSSGNESSGFDSYTVSAKYNFEDLYASVSYLSVDQSPDDATSFGAAVSYDYGAGVIAASMTDNDHMTSFSGTNVQANNFYTDSDGKPYEIVGTYTGVPNWTFKVAYADADRDGGSSSSVAAEAQYNFASNVAVAVGATNPDKNFGGSNNSEDILATALYVAF